LGYSSAGEVIAVADDVRGLKKGDKVACGGATAVHAEVVAVPVNLCVKLKEETPLDQAAFSTIGAIALQGIRQADLRLGENCVVIGLGLVGQLTILLLKAAGIKTIGIDVDPQQVNAIKALGADLAFLRDTAGLEGHIGNFTDGHGTDAVIITAGTNSLDPVELAGQLCRRKGKVVIVGAVPTGFTRKNYYVKELELRMSCSYGPGRYDAEYEEQGLDYPIGYVRWTENRNMQAFADLIASGSLPLQKVITHVFDFADAPKAYQMIVDRSEPFAGILLKYDITKDLKKEVKLREVKVTPGEPALGFIGAGSFAQNMILPNLQSKAKFIGIVTARPNNARYIADKYQFSVVPDNATALLENEQINTVFITTRHNSHYEYVMQSLQHKKNVFVEKPLCMTETELDNIRAAYATAGSLLMIGFNRRFAPLIQQLKKKLDSSQPISMHYRINAGIVPADHWTQDPAVGGGRIIGEVCHFIDLCRFLCGSAITTISAVAMKSGANTEDTVSIQLQFANGSIAGISYFANGSKELPKEFIEIFAAGTVYQMDDFKQLTTFGSSKSAIKQSSQDKGHAAELEAFLSAIKNGTSAPIPAGEMFDSMLATFRAIQSIRDNSQALPLHIG
jgi:polar amino acid transport system substrate-binding protein